MNVERDNHPYDSGPAAGSQKTEAQEETMAVLGIPGESPAFALDDSKIGAKKEKCSGDSISRQKWQKREVAGSVRRRYRLSDETPQCKVIPHSTESDRDFSFKGT